MTRLNQPATRFISVLLSMSTIGAYDADLCRLSGSFTPQTDLRDIDLDGLIRLTKKDNKW